MKIHNLSRISALVNRQPCFPMFHWLKGLEVRGVWVQRKWGAGLALFLNEFVFYYISQCALQHFELPTVKGVIQTKID